VLSKSGIDLYRIQCLRRHGDSLNEFIYPNQEDIDIYSVSHIVRVLSRPKVVRGVYYFPDDFSDVISGLR
jgi:hypothetical protein